MGNRKKCIQKTAAKTKGGYLHLTLPNNPFSIDSDYDYLGLLKGNSLTADETMRIAEEVMIPEYYESVSHSNVVEKETNNSKTNQNADFSQNSEIMDTLSINNLKEKDIAVITLSDSSEDESEIEILNDKEGFEIIAQDDCVDKGIQAVPKSNKIKDASELLQNLKNGTFNISENDFQFEINLEESNNQEESENELGSDEEYEIFDFTDFSVDVLINAIQKNKSLQEVNVPHITDDNSDSTSLSTTNHLTENGNQSQLLNYDILKKYIVITCTNCKISKAISHENVKQSCADCEEHVKFLCKDCNQCFNSLQSAFEHFKNKHINNFSQHKELQEFMKQYFNTLLEEGMFENEEENKCRKCGLVCRQPATLRIHEKLCEVPILKRLRRTTTLNTSEKLQKQTRSLYSMREGLKDTSIKDTNTNYPDMLNGDEDYSRTSPQSTEIQKENNKGKRGRGRKTEMNENDNVLNGYQINGVAPWKLKIGEISKPVCPQCKKQDSINIEGNTCSKCDVLCITQCLKCKRKFKRIGSLQMHYWRKHLNRNFECSNCQLAFTSDYFYNAHLKQCPKTECDKCEQCELTFKSSDELQDHLELSHHQLKRTTRTYANANDKSKKLKL